MASGKQKLLALGTLCVQNSALILSMRYARSVRHDTYLDSTVVLVMELVKLVVSCTLMWKMDGARWSHIAHIIKHSGAMAIPSCAYVVQNTLQLMAVQNLDASTFSVLSQLKVLTTAVCSRLYLKTAISARKWRALALLCGGCILVNYTAPSKVALSAQEALAANAAWGVWFFGLMCTLAMVSLSGATGVYIESQLKSVSVTLWERNVQLSVWGAVFATASILVRDGSVVAAKGFFSGWSSLTLLVVLCQSVGGLVTAVVVKYTDTIIKGFVVGLSVVITSILSSFLFGTELTMQFGLGAGAVLLSVFNFNEPDYPTGSSSNGSSAMGHRPALNSVYVPSAEMKKTAPNPGTPFISPADAELLERGGSGAGGPNDLGQEVGAGALLHHGSGSGSGVSSSSSLLRVPAESGDEEDGMLQNHGARRSPSNGNIAGLNTQSIALALMGGSTSGSGKQTRS